MAKRTRNRAGWIERTLLALAAAAAAIALPASPAVRGAACDEPNVPASQSGQVKHERKVLLAYGDNNVVRSGPGSRFAIVGVHPKGAKFTVIAKSGSWYNVRLSDTETGWIHTSLCYEYEDLSDLEFRPNPRLFSRVGSYLFTGYAGGYAFDRKSNSLALGGRLGYYILDFVQFEGGVSWTHVNRPAEIVESLFDLRLEAEEFDMLFYDMNVNCELLPGRQIVPFVTAGVGSSILRGRTEPSWNWGGGSVVFVSKMVALRWEVRSYRFESGTSNARRDNSNIAFNMGTSVLF
jgi:hypothetical protein